MQFKVKLQPVHEKSGLSKYRVRKDTGIAYNTITRYVDEPDVIVEQLSQAVITLCRYYGVDWNDPSIIEVIEEDETEMESPLLASA